MDFFSYVTFGWSVLFNQIEHKKKDGSLRTTLKLEKCVSRFDDYLILLEIPLCTVLFEEIFYYLDNKYLSNFKKIILA